MLRNLLRRWLGFDTPIETDKAIIDLYKKIRIVDKFLVNLHGRALLCHLEITKMMDRVKALEELMSSLPKDNGDQPDRLSDSPDA